MFDQDRDGIIGIEDLRDTYAAMGQFSVWKMCSNFGFWAWKLIWIFYRNKANIEVLIKK